MTDFLEFLPDFDFFMSSQSHFVCNQTIKPYIYAQKRYNMKNKNFGILICRILQRTSISTNIKERLDFSCALFGPDGGLVSNAPHIPVHLGAMQEAVQYQMKARNVFVKGEVILTNHPAAGGSHLPDLTVITPVFYG